MPHGQTVATLNRVMARPDGQIDLSRLLHETVRTLSNIDLEHGFELQQLERSKTDPDLKKQIAENLRRRHHERREPYVRLVIELKQRIMAAASLEGLQAASQSFTDPTSPFCPHGRLALKAPFRALSFWCTLG